MDCSLKSFREKFPEVKGVGDVSLLHLSPEKREEVMQWADAANRQSLEQGFGDKIFPIKFPKRLENRRETYNRENTFSVPTIEINEDKIVAYENFVTEQIFTEIRSQQNIDQEVIDSFESDTILSEEALEVQEDRVEYNYEDILFSPMPYDHNEEDIIVEDPVNFREWKNTRIKLLEELNKTKNRLVLRKEDRSKLKQINEAIKDLELELSSFDDTDPEFVHQNILEEIDTLNTLLDLNLNDPISSANMIETNRVTERMEQLEEAFYENKIGDVLVNFHNGLDENKVDHIKSQIGDLRRKYNNSLGDLIYNIITNNELVLQQKNYFEATGREQDYQNFVGRVKELLDPANKEQDIDGDSLLGKNFLGASSYDSILAEIISITRDVNKSKEAGITNLWKKQLSTQYDKIKNIQVNGEYFIDKFFEKDEFGVRMNKLINYISPGFYSNVKVLNSAVKDFYLSKVSDKASAYKDMMTLNKSKVDYIQVHKIKSFKEAFQNVPEFQEFFNSSDSEMESYEKELRDKIGNTAFELELQKQIDSIQNYLNDDFATEQDKYHKNPLRYIQHFYSENFDKADPTTADYILPTYVKYIPSIERSDYYNQEFNDLENLGVDGFTDFYTSAKNLLDYVRESGIGANWNDIISLRDSANREVMKNLNLFQKVWKSISVIGKNIFSEFWEGRLENPENDPNFERNFNTHYSNYGDNELQEIAKTLEKKSIQDLVDIATKEGLNIPEKYRTESPYNRAKLSNSIARNRVNKSVSLDLSKRINYAVLLAESANTRQSVRSIIKVIKQYAENNDLKNTREFVNVWEANNILQTGYLNHDRWGRWERVKIKLFGRTQKIYSEAETELINLLKEEQKNLQDKYDFSLPGMHYYNQGDKYFKEGEDTSPTEISIEEIQEAWGKHLNNKIQKLGKEATIGTAMFGLAWNMFKSYLWVSLPSGLKNRLAGYNQNNEAAASGLHDFKMDDLVVARRLLGGHNIKKTLDYTGLPKVLGLTNTKMSQQRDVLLHLVESLGLLENVMQDIDAGDGSGSFVGQGTFNKFKEVMSDFAMNNPEFHNQMEILVARMINVPIKRVDGTETTLFDPKTMSFPFDPKTMKLLPEFRTEENIANWERFVADKEGNAPQNVLVQQYIQTKHKLHGNYRPDDKIALQSTMTGRSASAFMKWAFENANNQYGTKKVSLATVQIDIKGRKIPLMERLPILGTHFVLQNVALPTVVGTSISLAAGLPAIAIGAFGLATATTIGYIMRKNKANVSMSWQDFGHSFNYLKEVALRTVKTSVLSSTRGLVNPLSDQTIEKWSGVKATYNDRNMDEKTRRLISESAQEVANKYNMAIQFMITGLILKSLYTLLTASPDDDEEEKMKKLEQIEGTLKFLINNKNAITEDMEKWSDPSKIIDTYNQVILLKFIKDSYNKVIKAPKKYNEGIISEEEMYYDMIQGVTGPALGLPRNLLRLTHPNKQMFSDDRVYDNQAKTWMDDYLLTSHMTGEEKYKSLVGKERRKVRTRLEGIYRRKIRDEFDRQGRTDYYNIDDIVSKTITEKFKRSNVNKKGKVSYQTIYENIDWNQIIETAKEEPVDINIGKKKRK